MMHYVVLDGNKTSEYSRGRVSGIIYALTGMPKKGYAWRVTDDGCCWEHGFDCDIATRDTITQAINKLYPDAILKVRTNLGGYGKLEES